MSDTVVHYQLDKDVGILRIDNPPVNALSHAVRAGFMAALDRARSDDSRLLLILCGGRTFIAGADISEFGKPPQAPSLPDVIGSIENFPKPVLAALHGNALGGGLEVALAAHFFSPANVMKLLEVVRAAKTAPEVLLTFMQLAKSIGKIAVAVGVCNGFVGNRMLKGYARQAQLLLLEGATVDQVDGAMEAWGMAMGPLAVGDLAGLDIGYRSRRDQGIESRSVKESVLADSLVEMERLGQKSGAGYYNYDPANRQRQPDPQVAYLIEDIAAKWGVKRRAIADEEIIDRLTMALVNEGAAIVAEGIAARPGDVDIVYLNGYGFPKWRGGPMFYADTLGLDTVMDNLKSLQVLTGDACWQPTPLLAELAGQGRTLTSLNR